MTPLTITPPTGIPKSVNQSMKRRITAIGSASGSVAKKKAVFAGSVSSSRAWWIRSRKSTRYVMSGSCSFFFVKERASRSDCASSRDLSIFWTHSPYTFDIPRRRRAFAVGAVSNT